MVYVSAEVKQMILLQMACKGLSLVAKDFPNAAAEPEVAKCTATEDNKDDGMGLPLP